MKKCVILFAKRWIHNFALLLFLAAFSQIANAQVTAYRDHKVKTSDSYGMVVDNGVDWIHSFWTNVVSFTPSRTAQIAPGSGDPGWSDEIFSMTSCPYTWYGAQLGADFTITFNSLEQLGTWTVICDGWGALPDYCLFDGCRPDCDPAVVYELAYPLTYIITVWNDPPQASITHSPAPAWNRTVTLNGNASDPDGGPINYTWSIINRPPGSSTGLSNANSASPSLSFSSENDIGDWRIQLHVDDNEGERRTFYHDLTVPNARPNISIVGDRTIDVLEPIELEISPTTDVDGGGTFDPIIWDIVQSPPRSSVGAQNDFSRGTTFTLPTSEADIGTWIIRVTATDNEGDSDAEEATIEVENLPPEINLVGSSEIDIGDNIQIETTIYDDLDGGPLTLEWDIIQAPQSGTPGVSFGYLGGMGAASSYIEIHTDYSDAGTWIFQLTATDNEGASESERFVVLVDAPPDAIITGSTEIGSLSFPLILGGDDSFDPDSRCNPPDYCHNTLDPPVREISPGIVYYTWSLLDVPFELWDEYPLGQVDDVFGIPAHDPTLTLNFGDIEPGEWTFQLQVFDGEGNDDFETFTVTVVDANGPPTAITSAPATYTVDLGGAISQNITLSGFQSFDLDNVLSGAIGPGIGISNYQWEVIEAPSGCAPPALPSGPTEHTFNLFTAGSTIDASCQGFWRLRLTVTDDDTPSKTGSTETSVIIGNCPGQLCIDYPTNLNPQFVEFTDHTDILIFYHLNSVLYDDPFFDFGMFTMLEIFHQRDLTIPVYTSFDPNVLASDKGGYLIFHWNGYTNDLQRPQSGLYHIKVTLLGGALGLSTVETIESDAIWIEVVKPNILPTSDIYVDFDDLVSGSGEINVNYEIVGATLPDELRWRVFDESNALIMEKTISPAFSGTIVWDGLDASGTTIPPGVYNFELEAFRSGSSLGVSDPYTLVVYRLALSPTAGPVSDTPPGLFVFVNSDDDNFNNVSDLTEAVASENDLIQVNITLDPSSFAGTLTISSTDATPPFRLWDTAIKGVETTLPATFNLPMDAVPPHLFIEGKAAGQTNLRLEFRTADGVTLGPTAIALTLIDVGVMTDTNNDHVIGTGDAAIHHVRVARWDNAYDVAFSVQNSADPGNFIEQDPSRFYLLIRNPFANTSPTVAEQITVQLGTMDAMVGTNDNLTDIVLIESEVNTGEFLSRSQLLTSHDIQVIDDPNADDEFLAHGGIVGAVADDATGDRTHRAIIDGTLRIQCQPVGAATAETWDVPVCNRDVEERRKLEIRVTVFNEPFQDIGYDHDANPATPVVGAGNGTFDFIDANGNAQHDVGELSEPFMDLSSGAAVFGIAGSRGGVVSQAQVDNQVERANIAWAQACIKIVVLTSQFVNAPIDVLGNDILADNVFGGTDEQSVFASFAPMASVDVAEVFFVAPIVGATAYTRGPSDLVAVLGEKTFIFLEPNLNINLRTLAHEIGHALDNGWDSANPQPIFYPAENTFQDNAVNSYRRLTLGTTTNCRTTRPAGNMTATGNRLLKLP